MYILSFTNSSKKDLKKIDNADKVFLFDRLQDFVKNFDNDYELSLIKKGIIKKLKGQKEDVYRLKLRSYRVIYKRDGDQFLILVVHITTREGAYK